MISISLEKQRHDGVLGKTYTLDSIALLLGDRDGLGAGRQRDVVFGILAEELEESVGVGGDELGKLRVASTELLQDRL